MKKFRNTELRGSIVAEMERILLYDKVVRYMIVYRTITDFIALLSCFTAVQAVLFVP